MERNGLVGRQVNDHQMVARQSVRETVSVVIPTFNSQSTIAECLQSVFSQGRLVSEIIVVDDGSTDDTANVVRRLANDRVVVIEHGQNLGGSAARNTGIHRASSDWIAFLDSDDLWTPRKIELQLQALANSKDAICYSNLEFFDGDEGRAFWNSRGNRSGERLSDYMIIERFAVQTSTLFMRLGIARQIKFDERLRRHQDWDFVLRAERAGFEFVYVDQALVRYRLTHANSVSRNASTKPTENWLATAGDLLDRKCRTAIELDVLVPRLVSSNPLLAAAMILRSIVSRDVEARRIVRASLQFLPRTLQETLKKKLRFQR